MTMRSLSSEFSVAPQVDSLDFALLAADGFTLVISNRLDGEDASQLSAEMMARCAEAAGLRFIHLPVTSGIDDDDVRKFEKALANAAGKVLAYCRTGTRSASLWALSEARRRPTEDILADTARAGYDLTGLRTRMDAIRVREAGRSNGRTHPGTRHDVVIVGGGAAGVAVAASLHTRAPALEIVIIEPRQDHDYQPGLTMVGAGIFDRRSVRRPEASIIPKGVGWIRAAVHSFRPDADEVILDDGQVVGYRALVVAPGIMLDWNGIAGLPQTLGRNGVTSNYSYDIAPYTWQLVRELKEGVALFTQPPMPIKCAGAPQKAMYLSCDHWHRNGRLDGIEVAFHNAGPALFGVKEYVPPLMRYIERYGIDLRLQSQLIAIDGEQRQAIFKTPTGEVSHSFDMIHVCPPQRGLPLVADSPLANDAGYVDVDESTLRHLRYPNVFGAGDCISPSNAKTAAAARQQAPVVARNLLDTLAGRKPTTDYDGYGSCPLTVERGKIILAEFGYGGKLLPTFPKWLLDGQNPGRMAWWLKVHALPFIYWNAMLKGREWLARPKAAPANDHV